MGFSQNNSLLPVYSNVVLWLIDKHLIGFFLVGNLVLSHDFFLYLKGSKFKMCNFHGLPKNELLSALISPGLTSAVSYM